MSNSLKLSSLLAIILFSSFVLFKPAEKPTLFLIGDSTVKNGKGDGAGGLWGWGSFIGEYFDAKKITVKNEALGGTSTRTFMHRGRWQAVLPQIKKGDYVIMQFGHNDSSPLDDSARARGTIKSNGDESQEIYNPITKQRELVYSYGWYLRKFVSDIKAKGAIPIICSHIPRNDWENGKVVRNTADYGEWAREAARQSGAFFIDLNQLIADEYDQQGEAKVRATYFNTKDRTHPIEAGSRLNAKMVVRGIKRVEGLPLKKYLTKQAKKEIN
ncbi:rhamnogalacturonan acetylesterase [Pedobacter sp. SYSU D00535]|uniref:rhamnogalacturonan acetylesterase n=1 Tax=Pedobacter sp. SYSU D00535 TaxID=2810308 RepID=UPI001A95B0CC|nr:rhamnogalacturonan acetylesterase [Pedobacter sp. SYSU D00535]